MFFSFGFFGYRIKIISYTCFCLENCQQLVSVDNATFHASSCYGGNGDPAYVFTGERNGWTSKSKLPQHIFVTFPTKQKIVRIMIVPVSLSKHVKRCNAPSRLEFWATNSKVVAKDASGKVKDVVTLFGPANIDLANCTSVFDHTFMHFPKAFTTYGMNVFEAGGFSNVRLSRIFMWEIYGDLECCLVD